MSQSTMTTLGGPLDVYNLVGLWVESILFGINCVAYIVCFHILYSAQSRRSAHRLLLAVISVLFAVATAHMGIVLQQLMEAFVDSALNGSEANTYFSSSRNTLEFIKNTLYGVIVIGQNCLLLWRIYIVWDEDFIVCLTPLLLTLGHAATVIVPLAMHGQPDLTWRNTGVFEWAVSSFSVNVAFNILATCMVAFRLWGFAREVAATLPGNHFLTAIVLTFFESGAVFTFATLAFFVLWITEVPMTAVVGPGLGCLVQLAMFSPLLIITRVGMGLKGVHKTTRSIFSNYAAFSIPQLRTQLGQDALRVTVMTEQDRESHNESYYDHAIAGSKYNTHPLPRVILDDVYGSGGRWAVDVNDIIDEKPELSDSSSSNATLGP